MPSTPLTSKLEFTLCKEAASIATTATELAAVHRLLRRYLTQADTLTMLDKVIQPLVESYQTLVYVLEPLLNIKTESDFQSGFDSAFDQYRLRLQEKNGLPRKQAECAYEAYLLLAQTRDANTRFPILRRTFDRLLNYIDKYVDNDSWLLMNIDNVYKMLNLLLGEITELNRCDPEEAWLSYDLAMESLLPFMQIINNRAHCMAGYDTPEQALQPTALGAA